MNKPGKNTSALEYRSESITVKEAKNWFVDQFGVTKKISSSSDLGDSIKVSPVWAFAQTADYLSTTPVVICPLQTIPQFNSLVRYFLILYKSDSTQVEARLILCRGENPYLTNNKAFHPTDFTGIVCAFDLSGAYAGPAHILNDGVDLGEFDPATGSGTITTSMVAGWWYDNSNIYYGGGGVFWVNTEPLHGGFPNTTFTPVVSTHNSSGGSGGGSGNSSGGSNNTNSLDLHFQNLYSNPMFIIAQYFEENNLQGEAYSVFGFLNTTERQILANAQHLIDPIYEFLVENNNSSEARQFIIDMLPYLFTYNYFFTKSDLSGMFSGFNNSPAPASNTPLSVNKAACKSLFNFNTYTDDVHSTWTDRAAVLGNIYLEFNYQNEEKLIHINCIGILIQKKGTGYSSNCLNRSDELAASILNSTILNAQNDINNNFPSGMTEDDFYNRIRASIDSYLNITGTDILNKEGCAGYQVYSQIYNSTLLGGGIIYQGESTNCDSLIVNCY
ncbi:MAG: hypothetical protein IT260_24415 [Saprospiraceae bacterium]|nr:hypothetical protein [Saprospiraceae bacterium]